ncbi:GNAT family N-acetyltransferase [Lactobacillus sp. ESL0679]|uniref:GNAT family N-acetyltransferase n=1 Tax=Lactobacillus sp. ESL0679 TaxID=2983209 RepID=UPI0023F9D46F|nr:GNAT family N-acetyltransferase [Lactobacillus sp. ESL0679]MDF7683162.1 GNAT family N-acetyltransferase [Lactobacillus sp. ESL0679]
MIIEEVALTASELKAVNQLINEVHQFDQTIKDPYLSNQYNYFSQMPTFVLAYCEQKMVGLTMLYADEEPGSEVELSVIVAPAYRKRGFADEMVKHAVRISQKYGYSKFSFVSEKIFLQQNPDFLNNNMLTITDSEYYMKASRAVKASPLSGLTVEQMTADDVDEVAKIYHASFDEPLTTTMNYLVQGLKDPTGLSFVLRYQNKIVGYCGVDCGQSDYFFGLLIAEEFRGRGFATFFIKQMMVTLQEQGCKEFSIEVDCDNPAAIHVYKNAGFVVATEVVYLVKNECTNRTVLA